MLSKKICAPDIVNLIPTSMDKRRSGTAIYTRPSSHPLEQPGNETSRHAMMQPVCSYTEHIHYAVIFSSIPHLKILWRTLL